ncbi:MULTISPECIES: tautomerase family protein [unclassified Streptomyces]|uniref:tautomerase family protein n=1 Tax=unclassified Streptomyces TaxID=2593676 RepID=UPI000DDA9857|nr:MULTISPECIES: tautomerase family protein [unclassified Streptomyces]QZZ26258.1 tautomerase family protein [Streptomyces sp. ST1015]
MLTSARISRGPVGRCGAREFASSSSWSAQIVTQHDPDEIIALDAGLGFERTPAGTVIVHIFTQRGRSTETRQLVYKTLAERLAAVGVGVGGRDLFVSYFENGPQDWSFADGRAQYVEGDLSVPGR